MRNPIQGVSDVYHYVFVSVGGAGSEGRADAAGGAGEVGSGDGAGDGADLQSVMAAVNNTPDGAWLAGSEEQVRDLSAEFRRRAFEQAVQMRINAADAGFPPSAQPGDSGDGQATGQ